MWYLRAVSLLLLAMDFQGKWHRTLKNSPHVTSAVCEALLSIIRNHFSVTCGTILLKKDIKPILNKKFTKNELFGTKKNIHTQRFQCFS